ncbi:MAG: WecB/TagA/CpsF family glycosyltransferase [Pirellulales bacterium]|nr:WecB/TagA/CpsF family glycosyltransferase [Pirellulales bacterium]
MIELGKYSVLGVNIDAVDYDAVVDRVANAAHEGRPLTVSALAVHGVMTGVLDRFHRHRLNSVDLLVPDGQPVRWALAWLHRTRLPDRVYGPTLMQKVCARAAVDGLPIFLFGSTPTVIRALEEKLTERFPLLKIAGRKPSAFRRLSAAERDEIVNEIRISGAKLAFVGLGCPRQEVFVFEMRDLLQMPLLAVGAAFNFHAGILSQAPPLLQQWGLEWMYRLVQEPRRLWKRYVLLNPCYLVLLGLQTMGLWRESVDPPCSAMDELRYG